MASAPIDLYRRVEQAERSWEAGDSAAAFDAFVSLLRDVVLAQGGSASFGFNEFLVMQRLADLAVQVGHIDQALDLYNAVAQSAAEPHMRALAAFKRLQIAVEAGRAPQARHAYAYITRSVWTVEPPAGASHAALRAWERTLPCPDDERPGLLAQMYLALGKLYNAGRRLDESTVWLERGIEHTRAASSLARLIAIPLELALANNRLALGAFAPCHAHLERAARAIATHRFGAIYGSGHDFLSAKASFIQGHLNDALQTLTQVEATTAKRGQVRARCASLLALAEIAILLNLLPEADTHIARAAALARDHGFSDLAPELARLASFRIARAQLFDPAEVGRTAAEMQSGDWNHNGTGSDPAPPPVQADSVVWSGDCLGDFEWREFFVYANLNSRPDEARRDLRDLCRDFAATGSPLITARLHAASGMLCLRQSIYRDAAGELELARALFQQLGAERELFQTTAYLARAVQTGAPARHRELILENDARLDALSSGLSAEQRNALLLNKYSVADETLRVEIEDILARQMLALNARWWKRPALRIRYWTRLNDFILSLDREREHRLRTASGYDRQAPPARGVRRLLARLALHPRRNQTVGFVVLPDQTFTFSFRRWRLECSCSSQLGRLGIATAVTAMHTALASGGSEGVPFPAAAKRLSERIGLAAVLAGVPARVDSLTILPDGALSLAPFSALPFNSPVGSSGYLVERFAINLDNISRRGAPAPLPVAPHAVVANYAGLTRPLTLASAASERASEWFEQVWGGRSVRVPSRDEFRANLPKAALLYYFGHGQPGGVDADRTGIYLDTPEREQFLSLRDFDDLDCAHLQQAIILACHGGDAATLPGRWSVSLPEALLRRGARSVLSPIWEIDEHIAKPLSDEFLDNAPTVGRAQALRECQRTILKAPASADPLWWAAFQIYGDPGPLKLAPERKPWPKPIAS